MFNESAPLTADGSFAKSLSYSKLWMCLELKRLIDELNIKQFNVVYSLGSWYGNMGIFMLFTHVPFKVLVDVDVDPEPLKASHVILKKLAPSKKIISICKDANKLKYIAGHPSLIINNSTNNMADRGWFEHVPTGTVVAIQSRNNEPDNKHNNCKTIDEFDNKYPLRDVQFLGQLSLKDPGDKYQRWMKIGIK
jgi:hypothetical protein